MKPILIILGIITLSDPVLADEIKRINCSLESDRPCICTDQGRVCTKSEDDAVHNPLVVENCTKLKGILAGGDQVCKITTGNGKILWVTDLTRGNDGRRIN